MTVSGTDINIPGETQCPLLSMYKVNKVIHSIFQLLITSISRKYYDLVIRLNCGKEWGAGEKSVPVLHHQVLSRPPPQLFEKQNKLLPKLFFCCCCYLG